MQQIDFNVKYKGYPYVAPPSITTPTGASVSAAWTNATANSSSNSTDDLLNFLTGVVPQIPTDISQITGVQNPAETGTDQWTGIGLDPSKWQPLEQFTTWLGETVGELNKYVQVVMKIMGIMELFITGFNAFASLINSAIALAQKTLEKYSTSGLGFGIYLNIVAPPAFLATKPGEAWVQIDRGGFDGFITRLQNSINNPTDENRPTFTEVDYVGGWVILLDTESIDEVWAGLKQLAGLFDFFKLFNLNLAPPAPQGFKGFCSYFVDNSKRLSTKEAKKIESLLPSTESDLLKFSKNKKFGIKLEWDNNYLSSAYLLSRSKVQGGIPAIKPYLPLTMNDTENEAGIKEPGLLTLAKDMLMWGFNGVPVKRPTRIEYEYLDPDFNSGAPVLIKAVPGQTVSYTDYFVNENDLSKRQYFYIIQACDITSLIKGPRSLELAVTVKKCNDMYSMADVIEHSGPNKSTYEFLGSGVGVVGSWSRLKAEAMIPWVGEFIGFISETLLGALKGLTTNTSDAFSKFLNEIKAKIQMYVDIINVLAFILSSFKNFLLGPQILMLNLKPVQGDMNTFVNRIRNAKLPAGDPGLSGANGISIGVVVAFGVSGSAILGVDAKAQLAAAEATVAQLAATPEPTNASDKVQLEVDKANAQIELVKAKAAAIAQEVTEGIAATKAYAMGKAFDFITGLFAKRR